MLTVSIFAPSSRISHNQLLERVAATFDGVAMIPARRTRARRVTDLCATWKSRVDAMFTAREDGKGRAPRLKVYPATFPPVVPPDCVVPPNCRFPLKAHRATGVAKRN